MVKAAGPHTNKDSEIWRVGDQYPPIIGARPTIEQVFLANFGQSTVESEQILEWGSGQRLVPATPRTTFAVSAQYSGLDTHLGMNPMAVVTLKQCSYGGNWHVPCVWCDGEERMAFLNLVDGEWLRDYWFAFVPDSPRAL